MMNPNEKNVTDVLREQIRQLQAQAGGAPGDQTITPVIEDSKRRLKASSGARRNDHDRTRDADGEA